MRNTGKLRRGMPPRPNDKLPPMFRAIRGYQELDRGTLSEPDVVVLAKCLAGPLWTTQRTVLEGL